MKNDFCFSVKNCLENHFISIMAVLCVVIFWVPLNRAVLACLVPTVSLIPDGSWAVQIAMMLAVTLPYALERKRMSEETSVMPMRRWLMSSLILLHAAGRLSGYYVFYGIHDSPLCYMDVCCIEIVLIETMSLIFNRIRKKKRKLAPSECPYFPFYPEQPSHGNSLDRKRWADILTDKIQTSYHNDAFSDGSFNILLNEGFGAGKTSFFNLLKAALEKKNIPCLEFQPWLSDSDKSLVDRFFLLLENRIKFSGDYHLLSLLRSYSVSVSKISQISLHDRIFHFVFRRTPVEHIYREIFNRLKNLESPIVILVDDVDRLNAEELISLLKLLRNTANFPNLVFVIASERTQMENILKDSGMAVPGEFLKKFFNYELLFPALDNETVRFLKDRILDIIHFYFPGKDCTASVDHVFRNRYMDVVFHNFRDICRFLNLLSFNLDSLKQNGLLDDVVITDMISISMIQFADSHIFRILRDDHSLLLELDSLSITDALKIKASVSSILMDSHTKEILETIGKRDDTAEKMTETKTELEYRSVEEYHDALYRQQPSVMDFTASVLQDIFDSSAKDLHSMKYINEYFKYFAGKYRRNELSDIEMQTLMQSPDTVFGKRAESLTNEGKNDFLFHKIFVYSRNNPEADICNIINKLLITFELHYASKLAQFPFLTMRLVWRTSCFSHSVSHLLFRSSGQKPDIGLTEKLESFFRSDNRFIELALILNSIQARDNESTVIEPEKLKVLKRMLIDRFMSEVLEREPFREDNIDTMVSIDELDSEYWSTKFSGYLKKSGLAALWLNEMFEHDENGIYALKNRYKIYFEHFFIPEWLSGAIQAQISCTLVYRQ